MVFQDDLAVKLQDLENFINFVRGWTLETKNASWIEVDPGYVTAKAVYTKMRQMIINDAAALPTV